LGLRATNKLNSRTSSASGKNLNFRASNALREIEALAFGSRVSEKEKEGVSRSSIKLGTEAESSTETGELRMECERLRTTVMYLNQKLKI
jgi:hypothetical protein